MNSTYRHASTMRTLSAATLVLAAVSHSYAALPFARATPESQGVPSRAVAEWVRAMDAQGGFNGFVLLRHGRMIAEGWWSPCETNGLHMLYSLSKSFTSTAIGMLADEGKLDLDERISDLFPDKLPPDPSKNLLEMRVRDLLSMATGHEEDSAPAMTQAKDGDWIKAFLAHPVPRRPGTWFRYDSGATYMLSAIVRLKSGERPSEYLAGRLFRPLGISDARWNRSPEGEDLGGWGLNMTTRDIARFGQFWLQRGEWNGRQLLSRDYVALASAKQISNASGPNRFEGDTVTDDWQAGYGFQFWRCTHGCYRAAGAYGQLAVIMPDQDAVLAVNSCSPMRKTLEHLWKILLPAMSDPPLPEAPEDAQELERLTASLTRPTVKGSAAGGGFGGVFEDDAGASFSLKPSDGGWMLSVTNAAWCGTVPVGFGEWRRGAVAFAADYEMLHKIPGRQAVASSGAWTAPDTFTAELFFVETPHSTKVTIQFRGRTAVLESRGGAKNVAAKISGHLLRAADTLGCCGGGGKEWEAQRKAALDEMRTFVYNTDGCDILYWPTNKPVSVEAFKETRLKYALNSRIAVVSYCPQSAGFGHFTCLKAGEPLTNSVTATHHGNPSARNAAADFFALGTDSLEMASDFCRSNNLGVFVSIRVNDQHDGSSTLEKGYSALFPPFKKAHPEYLMGSIDRSKNKHLFCGWCSWSCVDFTHREVRERMKTFVKQFFENYDVDGIEYDFNRHFILFKSVAEGGAASEEEKAMMTDLMRDLRQITEAAGRKRGKPIVVCMRAPDSVGYDNACGIDLERWFAERLVDVWIGAGYFHLNPWEDSVALAHKYGIRFYASIDESRISRKAQSSNAPFIPGRESKAAYAARFAEAMAAGADGVYVFNLEGRYLNEIAQIDGAHSEGENKIYFARFRGMGGYRPTHWLKDGDRFDNLPNIDPALPEGEMPTHKPGERYAFHITVGDDLASVNPPPKVTVKALTNLKAGDEIGLSVNGQKLDAGTCKDGLFTCKAPAGAVRKGRNEFAVTFPGRDGKYTLNDFAIEIRYR